MTDPISDMLARIRNGLAVNKDSVLVPHSRIKLQLAQILAEEGYISAVSETTDNAGHAAIELTLKYVANKPAITRMKRISTPGRRVYAGADNLPYVSDNLGVAVISTSQGLMTNKQARTKRIGGEVMCEIF